MPHLEKLPTWFVKGDQRRAAYYTINARELREDGWVEEGEKAAPAPQSKPQPEILVEVGQDAYDDDSIKEPVGERLEEMTKAELLDWAMDQGHDLPNNDRKADIFAACKEIEASL